MSKHEPHPVKIPSQPPVECPLPFPAASGLVPTPTRVAESGGRSLLLGGRVVTELLVGTQRRGSVSAKIA